MRKSCLIKLCPSWIAKTSFTNTNMDFYLSIRQLHPVLHLLNKCAQNNNTQAKNYTMSIFCDLSKTFGFINHQILIKKTRTLWYSRNSKKNCS